MTTEKRNAKIIGLLTIGKLSYIDIGNKFSLSKQRVHQIAKDNGLDNRLKTNKAKLKTQYKALMVDVKANMPTKSILKKHKIGLNKFYYIIKAGAGQSILRKAKAIK